MAQEHAAGLESQNIVSLAAQKFSGTPIEHYLHSWENIIFSLVTIAILLIVTFLSSRKINLIPGRLQSFGELLVEGVGQMFGDILGAHGRKFIPLVGTLFLYILCMNLLGLIPLMKSSTSSLSTTAALAVCARMFSLYRA